MVLFGGEPVEGALVVDGLLFAFDVLFLGDSLDLLVVEVE